MYARVKAGGLLAAAASVAGLAVFFVLAGHPERLGRLALRIERVLPARLARAVAGFVETFAQGLAVMRQPGRLLVSLLLSFPLWLSIAAGIWVTSRAFHMTFGYLGSFLVMTLLVVGVGDADARGRSADFTRRIKIAVVTFFGVAGRRRPSAAAIVLHAISFVPVTLLGLVFMAREGLSLGRMREMAGDGSKRQCNEVSVLRAISATRSSTRARARKATASAAGASASAAASATPAASTSRKSSTASSRRTAAPSRSSRQKLIGGLVRACEKRPVSVQQLEGIADRIESELQDRPEREISTTDIGAFIMDELRRIDQVAYVRFASVYRQFRDVGEFKREIDELQRNKTVAESSAIGVQSGASRVQRSLAAAPGYHARARAPEAAAAPPARRRRSAGRFATIRA